MIKKMLYVLIGAPLVLMLVMALLMSGGFFPLFLTLMMILSKSGAVKLSPQREKRIFEVNFESIRERNLSCMGAYGDAGKIRYLGHK